MILDKPKETPEENARTEESMDVDDAEKDTARFLHKPDEVRPRPIRPIHVSPPRNVDLTERLSFFSPPRNIIPTH